MGRAVPNDPLSKDQNNGTRSTAPAGDASASGGVGDSSKAGANPAGSHLSSKNDLCEELRSWIEAYPKEGSLDELLVKACDEIERLRAALRSAHTELWLRNGKTGPCECEHCSPDETKE